MKAVMSSWNFIFKRRKITVILIILIISLLYFLTIRDNKEKYDYSKADEKLQPEYIVFNFEHNEIPKKETTKINEEKNQYCGDKWVIVTTIFAPTNDVKYLADSSFGWCVLVVGDAKTPPDWSYKDVIYLGMDKQEVLARKYTLINLIPKNNYLRKMIGYLYAIENGAQVIYETDDDIAPLDGLYSFHRTNFNGLEAM